MTKFCDLGAVPLVLGICLTEKEFLRTMALYGHKNTAFMAHPDAIATMHTFAHPGNPDICLICMDAAALRMRKTKQQVYGTLVHECVHVLQSLKEAMNTNEVAREWEAYFVQFISQFCFEQYDEFIKGNRNK